MKIYPDGDHFCIVFSCEIILDDTIVPHDEFSLGIRACVARACFHHSVNGHLSPYTM